MLPTISLDPVSQSCSGFAQARIVVIEPKLAAMPTVAAIDAVATSNVLAFRSQYRMVEAFETASRAARTAILEETNALVSESLALTFSTFRARTFADLLDLQGSFARRRYLAAASLASAMLMPTSDQGHARA